jgi:hypothetical protein
MRVNAEKHWNTSRRAGTGGETKKQTHTHTTTTTRTREKRGFLRESPSSVLTYIIMTETQTQTQTQTQSIRLRLRLSLIAPKEVSRFDHWLCFGVLSASAGLCAFCAKCIFAEGKRGFEGLSRAWADGYGSVLWLWEGSGGNFFETLEE